MEGYLFDRDDAKAAFRRAAEVAHAHGRRVSLTLSDSFCVDRHRDDFRRLVRDQVDLLFGNEDELCSLYEVGSLDEAIAAVRRDCPLVAVTAGAEGSYVVTPDGTVRRRRRARRSGARHDRRRRPVRRRVPARLDDGRVAARLRPARFDRRRRGDQPRRPEAPRRAAYAGGVSDGVRRRRTMRRARWLAAEPDADIRAELQALIDGDPAELAERFAGRLKFGTAGSAGRRRRRAAADEPARRPPGGGRAGQYCSRRPIRGAAERGVVIGYDVRRKSDLFAHDTARVMAAAGIRAMLLAGPLPDAGAGVVDHRARRRRRGDGHRVAQPARRQRLQGVPRRRRPDRAAPRRRHRRRDRPRRRHRGGPRRARRPADHDARRRCRRRPTSRRSPRSGCAPTCPASPWPTRRCTASAGRPRARRSSWPASSARVVVAEQFEPDGTFPTVSFPNPEEPGAMDLLLALADESGADLAIANDPDADRLGAAIPQPDGSWRRLGGDEIGWLLADHILANTTGDDRLVVTTLVSSSLLGEMAKSYGVHAKETLHRVQVDRPDDPRPPRAALRARLRAGARLPRRARARSTRTASRRR